MLLTPDPPTAAARQRSLTHFTPGSFQYPRSWSLRFQPLIPGSKWENLGYIVIWVPILTQGLLQNIAKPSSRRQLFLKSSKPALASYPAPLLQAINSSSFIYFSYGMILNSWSCPPSSEYEEGDVERWSKGLGLRWRYEINHYLLCWVVYLILKAPWGNLWYPHF